MDQKLYSTSVLYGVLANDEQMRPPSNYWLSLCFPEVVQFDEEEIDFAKLGSDRKLAPLVVPTAQGVPIYSAAERVLRFRPAYVKPKDPINASRVIRKIAGQGELAPGAAKKSPAQRYNELVADILRQHRFAIERRWEWMAAQAILYGRVTLKDDNYPETTVDFERDSNHEVTLAGNQLWTDTSNSTPLADIERWKAVGRRAFYGGPLTRITMGGKAWEAFRAHPDVQGLLKTDYAPPQKGGLNVNLGVLEGLEVEWVGKLNGTTDIYVYSDWYTVKGAAIPFMDERDIVMTGPNVRGVRAFGAIQDINANFQPLAMFPKMWPAQDPSATFIMTQSAPLMVPMNPNNTLRARVVA